MLDSRSSEGGGAAGEVSSGGGAGVVGVKIQGKQTKAAGFIGQMQRVWHVEGGGAVGETPSRRESVCFTWIDPDIWAWTPYTCQ